MFFQCAGSFYPFLIYTVVATAIASAFTVIPFLVAPARVDLDKSSAYECGFDAFGDSRQTFSVSFYLVAIMYLLFDIEVRLHKGSGVVCVL
jgi:NADH:ubiquinone oxidoreductase subunit 3 (subunit A)